MGGSDTRAAGTTKLSLFSALPGLILAAGISAASAAAPAAETDAPKDARNFADRIADRYGAAEFPRVESIHFVFNVRYNGKDMAREWTWFPKQDSVLYRGKDEKGLTLTAAYSRRNKYSMGAGNIAAIDKSFVNDQYWFLFPLHLRWDGGLDLALGSRGDRLDNLVPAGGKPKAAAPAAAPARMLTVRYPKQGGYTPGDAYDLVATDDGTILRWMFHRSGADTVTMQAEWAPPKVVGGLPVSLDRPGKNGFKVWFTGVKVDGLKP
jgi:hypothetical protein